jgi:hypothetical protein
MLGISPYSDSKCEIALVAHMFWHFILRKLVVIHFIGFNGMVLDSIWPATREKSRGHASICISLPIPIYPVEQTGLW